MRARDAVITVHVRSPVGRGFFALVTAVAWTGFIWLVLPAITAVLWLVGLSVAYEETLSQIRQVDGALLLGIIAAAALGACVLVAWAEIQRHRFTGVERRARTADVDVATVGAVLGATDAVTRQLQAGRVMVLHLREDGSPLDVVEHPPIPRPVGPRDAVHGAPGQGIAGPDAIQGPVWPVRLPVTPVVQPPRRAPEAAPRRHPVQ